MGGLRAKNELIGEGSVERQLESDESPTVWIKDTTTPPVPTAIRREGWHCVSTLNSYIRRGEEQLRTKPIVHEDNKLCSTLEWQLIESVIVSLRYGIARGGD